MLKSNVSDLSRRLKRFTTSRALFTTCGDMIRFSLEEAFEEMVRNTPQWSGTTAASWNMGLGAGASEEVRTQPEPKNEAAALQKGHAAAVNIALANNIGKLNGLSKGALRMDVFVKNNAPGATMAEVGYMGNRRLRAVNRPGQMLKIFEGRMRSALLEIQAQNKDLLQK